MHHDKFSLAPLVKCFHILPDHTLKNGVLSLISIFICTCILLIKLLQKDGQTADGQKEQNSRITAV